jgi:hypothetical protein
VYGHGNASQQRRSLAPSFFSLFGVEQKLVVGPGRLLCWFAVWLMVRRRGLLLLFLRSHRLLVHCYWPCAVSASPPASSEGMAWPQRGGRHVPGDWIEPARTTVTLIMCAHLKVRMASSPHCARQEDSYGCSKVICSRFSSVDRLGGSTEQSRMQGLLLKKVRVKTTHGTPQLLRQVTAPPPSGFCPTAWAALSDRHARVGPTFDCERWRHSH